MFVCTQLFLKYSPNKFLVRDYIRIHVTSISCVHFMQFGYRMRQGNIIRRARFFLGYDAGSLTNRSPKFRRETLQSPSRTQTSENNSLPVMEVSIATARRRQAVKQRAPFVKRSARNVRIHSWKKNLLFFFTSDSTYIDFTPLSFALENRVAACCCAHMVFNCRIISLHPSSTIFRVT
jgi:hypothetical protein